MPRCFLRRRFGRLGFSSYLSLFRLNNGRGFVERRQIQVIVGMTPDAQQAFLQVTITSEPIGGHHPVDPSIDHDGNRFGDRGGNTYVLFDEQNGNVALLHELRQHCLDLLDNDRRETLGRLVQHQQLGILQQRTGNRDHLLFTAGKLSAPVAAPFSQARKGVVDPLNGPGAATPVRKPQVLIDGK